MAPQANWLARLWTAKRPQAADVDRAPGKLQPSLSHKSSTHPPSKPTTASPLRVQPTKHCSIELRCSNCDTSPLTNTTGSIPIATPTWSPASSSGQASVCTAPHANYQRPTTRNCVGNYMSNMFLMCRRRHPTVAAGPRDATVLQQGISVGVPRLRGLRSKLRILAPDCRREADSNPYRAQRFDPGEASEEGSTGGWCR